MKNNNKNKKHVPENLQQSRLKVLREDSPYAFRESYVRLRTNLMFGLAAVSNAKCKTIAVTSSNPGEGKTTTTVNVAISFAMLGKKTLIIDADMRRPQVGRLLDTSARDGFSNLLGGFGECYVHNFEGLPLDFITAGKMPPNPSELLASPAFAENLEKLKKDYDYIFVDTPPVNSVADAQIIAPHVDGVVLVVRAEATRMQELVRAEEALKKSGGKIIGVVANDVESKGRSYGYKYGKYKKYKRYYGNAYDYESSNETDHVNE